jgi:hypothetical protein
MNNHQPGEIAMTERYQAAIQLASQIVADVFMNDLDGTLERGARLDKAMQDVIRELGRQALTRVYNAVDATLIQRYQGPGWKIKAHPTISFTTIFGEVQVRSAYLWHNEYAPGIRPLKECMGVEGNHSSEAVQRALVDFGSEKSFARATRQFAEHYGWEVERGTMRNQTEQAARHAETYVAARLAHRPDATSEETAPLPVETLVVELDGCEIRTGQVMTAAAAGRSDLPPAQVVRVEAWKEVRTGLVRP